jgi:hypothetical protein
MKLLTGALQLAHVSWAEAGPAAAVFLAGLVLGVVLARRFGRGPARD